ncbi:MAG: aldehyde ferredoxin oxidoreductase family protein [Candidatus Bathyarchaeia archaeon]
MESERALRRVLHVDLSGCRFWVEDRPELFAKHLGGSGVAARLLREECPKGADPLSPDNVIVLAVGPLTGLFPMASKTVAMFKSPLTGNLGESHAGGRSAIALRLAGYGAIVVKGASSMPVYLAVHEEKVKLRDASGIWGMANSITVGRVIRELEPSPGFRTIMRIGRAGENLVAFASVNTETYRHFGRLGLGAVFGSKKLKAIVISGKRSIRVRDMRLYREVYNDIFNQSVKTPVMRKYHNLGTSMNVLPLNAAGALPTLNLKGGRFEGAEQVSGEAFAEHYLGRRVACAHCPVACIHLAALREPYAAEPYFYKTTMVSYDYEPIYSLGSMLGVSDPKGLLSLFHEVETQGLDAMSAGVVLAWATEAMEKELISVKETLGLRLTWGDYGTYLKAVRHLANRSSDFYHTLGQGLSKASERYGGSEFALSFGGNEMPGYHTGPAAYTGYLVGARHSHLDGAGYALDEAMLKEKKALSSREVAEGLLKEEAWRQVLSSLVVCFFARGIYRPGLVAKTLSVAGYDSTAEGLEQKGLEILREKNRFKLMEGFNPDLLNLPRRVLETPTPLGTISESLTREAQRAFFEALAPSR